MLAFVENENRIAGRADREIARLGEILPAVDRGKGDELDTTFRTGGHAGTVFEPQNVSCEMLSCIAARTS